MRFKRLSFTFILIAFVLTSCATVSPTSFYTLTNIPNESNAKVSANSLNIELRPIIVPERLKRAQIVLNSPNNAQIIVLENDRWGSAFNDELHDAISSELNFILSNNVFENKTEKNYRVTIELQHLEILKGDYISAGFSWKVTRLPISTDKNEVKAATCNFEAKEMTARSIDAIVRDLQKIVFQLSTEIADSIKNTDYGKDTVCKANFLG